MSVPRTPDGRWQPGVSGNPRGRPRRTVGQGPFRISQRSLDAIFKQLEQRASRSTEAAELLLSYTHGKAGSQPTATPAEEPLNVSLTEEEMQY